MSEQLPVRPFRRPHGMGTFEFVVIAALRAGQLSRGCLPRVAGVHVTAVIAQLEVAEGKVTRELTAQPDPTSGD